ncbi:gypsy/ty3 retroelement polyprotein [Tanacetum coccineum]|uniref:Gypsy/ty3 retroelement polyprotein n=1 Tax=Tanacetum coccineum TaxID=301880 RepID=A0ABQ5ICY4_9ASTR
MSFRPCIFIISRRNKIGDDDLANDTTRRARFGDDDVIRFVVRRVGGFWIRANDLNFDTRLPTELEMSVRMFKPTTLAHAYSLTNLQEAILEAVRKKNKPAVNSNVSRFGSGGYYRNNSKPTILPLPASTKEYDEELVEMPNNDLIPQISLNALSGVSSYQTMRVVGLVAKPHELHILVYSGSTHNFLDIHVAKRLSCNIRSTCPLLVNVAGGKQLMAVSECKGFKWQLKGETFTADVMLLPLGGCDMVLGIQWLATLGDIKCNFQELKMQFVYNNKKLCLRDVFEVPKQLPPMRSHDHKIPLVPRIQPVNIRPYKHPLVQKDAIESLLNKNTIKDKFPIPIIEELIDELNREVVFSKMDLREFLRKFTLVFFDDILVYSKSVDEHLEHLTDVLAKMRDHSLFALMIEVFREFLRKCVFGNHQVEYLGHVISSQGVATDPAKVQAMQTWLVPTNLKQLRGFLGLTGYYKRFIKDFATLNRPLT